ncbi:MULTISPECIES: sugar MFS transporter [unclassified Sphingomonas]|uniref:sugar MFS transporter n=1 Tax=unclassified Sphingomonas TaxID=196159 RepID=UPI00226A02A4|nr:MULTISPECIES: sugar MFS transporter [unclassified Sphingomonas]
MQIESKPAGAATRDTQGGYDAPDLRVFVFALFFIFGGITSLNDVVIPKLKELFTLNYTQAMLVQFCFFTAYALIGIPGARLVKRIGYMRGAVAGLVTMLVGCLLFIPASRNGIYGLFLLALFVLASGVVIVQVVSNPLVTLLGKPQTASSRLTFAQAFNSLGTTIFPFVGSIVILAPLAAKTGTVVQPFWDVTRVVDPSCGGQGPVGGAVQTTAYRIAESQTVAHAYTGLAIVLAIIAAVVWLLRNRLKGERHEVTDLASSIALLKRPRVAFGALCIFLYVGAEVSIGSTLVNYLRSSHTLCLTGESAGKQLLFYWGGAMIGRFIGSAVLRVVNPGKVLAGTAVGAIALVLISIATTGGVSADTLLAVGLMNSIMFPTIFSLASEKLGQRAADGSGIINVAIFGGAVVPLVTGGVADAAGLTVALLIPVVCYVVIAAFGLYARRPAPDYADA